MENHQASLQRRANDNMVARLQLAGTLRSPSIVAAFLAVNRAVYVGDAAADRDGRSFADMALRIGAIHLSAPSIYAFAAEALAVRPGDSFLNLGSGTGYFSSIIALLAGSDAVNHGVEQRLELVEHARAMAAAHGGLPHLEFFHANALQLRTAPLAGEARCMAYDRIYISAAVAAQQMYAFSRLLSEGGVLVGPFEEGLGYQYLCKVVRTGADTFVTTRLHPVQFAPLLRPAAADLALLPPLVLEPLVWSPEHHARFPAQFQAAVRTLLWASSQPECPLALLPRELLFRIISDLRFYAFARPARAETPGGGDQEDAQDDDGTLQDVLEQPASSDELPWSASALPVADSDLEDAIEPNTSSEFDTEAEPEGSDSESGSGSGSGSAQYSSLE